jgi:hypothetical protein
MSRRKNKRVPRVKVVVIAEVVGARHVATLDIPAGCWSLADLHELGRTVADAAGFLGVATGTVTVEVSPGRGRL